MKKNLFKRKIPSAIAFFLLIAFSISVPVACGKKEDAPEMPFVATKEQEYFFSDYNAKSNADELRQNGVDTFKDKNIVFNALTYEEFVYLLQQEGDYLILLGGSWCHNTRAAAPYINEYAHEYGIKTIYNFDFYLDGENSSTHVRVTDPAEGADKNAGQQYNHLYGELITRYLTNLNDWVEYKEDGGSAVTYTDSDGKDVRVAKAQVPFLFLYNKNNTERRAYDFSEKKAVPAESESGKTYPIVVGFEEMVERDDVGVYAETRVKNEDGTVGRGKDYITDAYKVRLKSVFDYISDNKITLSSFTDADYVRLAYNEKSGEEIFRADEAINYEILTYRQFDWLLQQDEPCVILFAGTWCPNTQAIVDLVNDYAAQNDVTVYTFDTKLDGGYAAKYFSDASDAHPYPDAHIRVDNTKLTPLYAKLVTNYLYNIQTLNDEEIPPRKIVNGDVQVSRLQVPFLFAYDKNAKKDGKSAPVLQSLEVMLLRNHATDSDLEAYGTGVEDVFRAYDDAIARQ